ncbi:MAG TPA: GerMN domain-containing protein [Ruminiclostridium sp.]
MTNNRKMKVLASVMLCFIIVLVTMLIYAKSIYDKNENPADSTIIPENSSASQSVESTATDTSTQSASSSSEVTETIDLKLYYFDADDYDNVKEIRTVTIDKKLYQDDITAAINKVLSSTGLNINKAVIKGNSVTIDLPREVALKFNMGSSGGVTYTNILAMTILNLPNIEKMEVTVDGVAGILADHFSFNGTFTKSEDGKKYTFTESDNESKGLY